MGSRGEKIYRMEMGRDGKYHRVQYLKNGNKLMRSKYSPKTVSGNTRTEARRQLPPHKKRRVRVPRVPTPKTTRQSPSAQKRFATNIHKSKSANKLVDSYNNL